MWKQIQQSEQNDKIAFNTYRLNIKIDQTYPLLYCRGCIKITNNDGTINVETKNNRVNKMTKLNSIHVELTLKKIKHTHYYFVKDTFRG